jgi:CheY-like chemotaxis protein
LSARKTFLLVEDDAYDALFVETEFEKANVKTDLRIVRDGVAARQYMEGQDHYGDRQVYPLPDVILLDLEMPRMNGFEFLEWLRSRSPAACRLIPVVVMSASPHAEEVERAHALGANAFLAKPVDWQEYRTQIRTLGLFWGGTSETLDLGPS